MITMNNTAERTNRPTPTPGFAIQILSDTELGTAMLIAEDGDGNYEPVANASTINEGRELAQDDLRLRVKRRGNSRDAGRCPFHYKLWARGLDGFRVVATWKPGRPVAGHTRSSRRPAPAQTLPQRDRRPAGRRKELLDGEPGLSLWPESSTRSTAAGA